jgi:hypothetical protein
VAIDLESVVRFAVKTTKERGLPRLAGSDWIGMGGRISPESVDGLPRNTQSDVSDDLCVLKREGVG